MCAKKYLRDRKFLQVVQNYRLRLKRNLIEFSYAKYQKHHLL